jgi:hypothetical protein
LTRPAQGHISTTRHFGGAARRPTVSTSALNVYLEDHWAGSTAGSELVEKLRSKHQGTPQEHFFSELAAAIRADRETLRDLMTRLAVPKNPIKEAAGWTAEKLSRLKLNERLTRSPEVTILLEMETLSLGIEGKLALWKSLQTVADRHPALAATPLDELVRRAQEQLDGLERHRLTVAADALEP